MISLPPLVSHLSAYLRSIGSPHNLSFPTGASDPGDLLPSNAKPKPSPSSPSSQSLHLEDLFSAIHCHAKSSEYEQAVKVADQVLTIAPGDEDALRCKVVALVKKDRALS